MIRSAMWLIAYTLLIVTTGRALLMGAAGEVIGPNATWPVVSALLVLLAVSIIDRITWK